MVSYLMRDLISIPEKKGNTIGKPKNGSWRMSSTAESRVNDFSSQWVTFSHVIFQIVEKLATTENSMSRETLLRRDQT